MHRSFAVTEELVKHQVDKMISLGLLEKGYKYFNLDGVLRLRMTRHLNTQTCDEVALARGYACWQMTKFCSTPKYGHIEAWEVYVHFICAMQ
jgi:hypothetical protein